MGVVGFKGRGRGGACRSEAACVSLRAARRQSDPPGSDCTAVCQHVSASVKVTLTRLNQTQTNTQ